MNGVTSSVTTSETKKESSTSYEQNVDTIPGINSSIISSSNTTFFQKEEKQVVSGDGCGNLPLQDYSTTDLEATVPYFPIPTTKTPTFSSLSSYFLNPCTNESSSNPTSNNNKTGSTPAAPAPSTTSFDDNVIPPSSFCTFKDTSSSSDHIFRSDEQRSSGYSEATNATPYTSSWNETKASTSMMVSNTPCM